MSKSVRCNLCGWTRAILAGNKTTAVTDVVFHAISAHAYDARLEDSRSVELVDDNQPTEQDQGA